MNAACHVSEDKGYWKAAATTSSTYGHDILNLTVGRILEEETTEDRLFVRFKNIRLRHY